MRVPFDVDYKRLDGYIQNLFSHNSLRNVNTRSGVFCDWETAGGNVQVVPDDMIVIQNIHVLRNDEISACHLRVRAHVTNENGHSKGFFDAIASKFVGAFGEDQASKMMSKATGMGWRTLEKTVNEYIAEEKGNPISPETEKVLREVVKENPQDVGGAEYDSNNPLYGTW